MTSSSKVCVGLLAVVAAGCGPAGGGNQVCGADEDIHDCFPELDKQIDGAGEDDTIVSDDVDMCVTQDGRIFAAWIDTREQFADVWFTRSVDGGKTWLGSPVNVKTGAGNASGLDLDCVGDTIVMVWEDTRDSATDYTNIRLTYSIDGGDTWPERDVRLDDDPEGRSISLGPKVAVRRNAETRTDRVYVTWFDQLEGAPSIYAVAGDITAAGLDTGDRVPVVISALEGGDPEPGGFWAGNPQLTVGGSGKVHVVWEDKRDATQDVYYAGSNPAGTEYNEPQRMTVGEEPGVFYGFSPDICADGPNAYVVWHDTRAGDARDIFLQYTSDAGQTWFRAAKRVETDAAGSAESFNAKVACLGNAGHVVWQDNRDGAYDIYYREIIAGKTAADEGEAEIRLDGADIAGQNISERPVITVRDGVVLVGWLDRRDAGEQALTDIYYNFRTLNEDGSVDQDFEEKKDFRLDSIAPGTKYADQLQLGLWKDPDGEAGDLDAVEVYASWIDNRDGGGDKDVYFSRSFLGEGVTTYAQIQQLLGKK